MPSRMFSKQVKDTLQKRKIDYMCAGRLPFDSQGTTMLPKVPMRPLVRDFLKKRSILDEDGGDSFLGEHLLSKANMFAKAIAEQDEETLFKVAEKGFAQKLVGQFGELSKKNLTYTPSEKEPSSYILDRMFIKGVSTDREKNGCNWDY
jgi:hypothetical protein